VSQGANIPSILGVETEYVVAEAGLRASPAVRGATGPASATVSVSDEPCDATATALPDSPRDAGVIPTVARLLRGCGRGITTAAADDAQQRRLAGFTSQIVAEVARTTPHLPGERSGIFLRNAARLYIDCFKCEYSTPEASSPADAVSHVMAGRRILDGAVRRRNAAERDGADVRLFAVHLDYDALGSHTWAVHENYHAPAVDPRALRRALAPHLATRVIFGAGGFSPDPAEPLRFVLSPRTLMLSRSCSGEETDAMFHGRSAATWAPGRVHLLCCESLRSHVGTYLMLGTTALMVLRAARGIVAAPSYTPLRPRLAMRGFAGDPFGRYRAICADGQRRGALEIQRHLCALAESSASGDDPAWVGELLATWRWFLGEYESHGRRGLARSIDWAIKYDLFDAHCRSEAHMTLEQVLAWNRALSRLTAMAPSFRMLLNAPDRLVNKWAGMIPRSVRQRLETKVVTRGLCWSQLPDVLRLRLQLRELDWRFCQIGDGIFDRLEDAGVLRHAAPGVTPESIERACREPPSDTRAAARGATIARWHRHKAHAAAKCEWNRIVDAGSQQILRLDDPTEAMAKTERWELTSEGATHLFDRAIALYRMSHFAQSWELLSRLRDAVPWERVNAREVNSFPFRLLRYSAWVAARLGRLDALEYLQRIYSDGIDSSSMYKVADHLYCYRFVGLAPSANSSQWLDAARTLMRGELPSDEPLAAAVREHVAAWLLHQGRLDEVVEAIGPAERESCTWRRARIQSILAELYRRRGELERARGIMEAAATVTTAPFEVLIAEQITPMRARLAEDPAERRRLLDRGAEVLTAARHRMALARVLVLKAQGCGDSELATRLLMRVHRLGHVSPALVGCPAFRMVIARWEQWCGTGDAAACDHWLL
jgi:hypothetical protein